MFKNKIALILFLALSGCQRNPGPFPAKVGYKYHLEGQAQISVSSKKFGYFNVYNSPFYDTVFYGDQVIARCKYMGGVFGGPYECQILEKVK